MRDLLQDNGDSEVIELCRRYAAMNPAEREAWRATIDANLAGKLLSFAIRTGEGLIAHTSADIELALLAVGLAYEHWDDERDVYATADRLRRLVESDGEAAHLFIESVVPLLPTNAGHVLRNRFGRRLHTIRFADNTAGDIPQHNVLGTLLAHPRFALILVRAIEAAMQIRIARKELRDLFKAVRLEQYSHRPFTLATNNHEIHFVVQLDRYHSEILIQFVCESQPGLVQRLMHRSRCQKAAERFRAVIEGFTAAFAPDVFAIVDRLTMFKRSTHHIFEWRGNAPLLKNP